MKIVFICWLLIIPFVLVAQTNNTNFMFTHQYKNCTIRSNCNVEEQASYKGGCVPMMENIGKHLRYPKEMLHKKQEGTVKVLIVLQSNGEIGSTKIIESTDAIFSNSVENAINQLKNFKPASNKDCITEYEFTLHFKIK